MKRLDLYVGRAVLTATLLAWLVVAVLDSVFTLLGQLGDIGRGNYAFKDALAYVLFSLPTHAYQAFPMAALIGTVLGLGNLAAGGVDGVQAVWMLGATSRAGGHAGGAADGRCDCPAG
jgi:lipopolysaccharide export system permease protein